MNVDISNSADGGRKNDNVVSQINNVDMQVIGSNYVYAPNHLFKC